MGSHVHVPAPPPPPPRDTVTVPNPMQVQVLYPRQFKATKTGPRVRANVRHIACGEWHTLALADECHVFAWGQNKRGQLGTGDLEARWNPTQLTSLNKQRVIQVLYNPAAQHTPAQ